MHRQYGYKSACPLHCEGPEGVKWELGSGFAHFQRWELGFSYVFYHWEWDFLNASGNGGKKF